MCVFVVGCILLLDACSMLDALAILITLRECMTGIHFRTGFALFIAAGSFFSIRARVAKILPEPFTTAPMRALPIVLLFGAMFYWLWRVRRRTLPVLLDTIRRHSPLAM